MQGMEYYIAKAMEFHKNLQSKQPQQPYETSQAPRFFSEKNLFPENEEIRIQTHPQLPGQPTGPHYHNYFEITYVYRGSFMHTIHGETVRQSKGQLILFNLNAVHSVWVEDSEDIVFNIMIRKSVIEHIFLQLSSCDHPIYRFFLDSVFDINKLSNFLILDMSEEIEQILYKIIAEYYDHQDFYRSMILSYLQLLFSELARKYKEKTTIPLPENNRSTDILYYIQQNFTSLSLKALADTFGYSQRHMGRLIFSWTGKTFTELINGYKIDNVCRLIESTNLPISRIVEISGFTDPSHFYKTFKKKKGFSFSEYRKNL